MRNEKAVARPHGSDALDQVSGWLDAFPDSAEQATAQDISTPAIPFSEW